MHWNHGASAGFTRSTPWETLDPDSLTANVALEDDDRTSLLNHYRRLIHLRANKYVLGSGELIPLEAAVMPWRRTPDALVIAWCSWLLTSELRRSAL
jgi:glycosidase